jgi:hypothetical protein
MTYVEVAIVKDEAVRIAGWPGDEWTLASTANCHAASPT